MCILRDDLQARYGLGAAPSKTESGGLLCHGKLASKIVIAKVARVYNFGRVFMDVSFSFLPASLPHNRVTTMLTSQRFTRLLAVGFRKV